MSRLKVDGADDGVAVFSLDAARNAAVAALVIWIMFNSRYPVPIDIHSPHLKRYIMKATVLGPLDVVFLILAILAIPLLLRRRTYKGWPVGLLGAVTLSVVTLAFVLTDPSPEGFARFVRLAGISGAIVTIRWMSPTTLRTMFIWPVTLAVVFQSSLALAQTFVFDSGAPARTAIGVVLPWTRGYGTMDSPYSLAAFTVVGIAIILSAGAFTRLHPLMWLSVILGSASVATSFGRTPALAVLAIGGVYGVAWMVQRKRGYLASSIAAFVPMVIGIAISWTGWQVRAYQTASGSASGRGGPLGRAFTIIEANPVFGVGPGRFGPTLAEIGLTSTDWEIVHNVPVLVAAEYGVPFGVLFTLWLVLLGVVALSTSVRAAAVFVSIVPVLLFAYSPVVYTTGVAGFGLWLATLDYHRRHRSEYRSSVQRVAEEPAPASA